MTGAGRAALALVSSFNDKFLDRNIHEAASFKVGDLFAADINEGFPDLNRSVLSIYLFTPTY